MVVLSDFRLQFAQQYIFATLGINASVLKAVLGMRSDNMQMYSSRTALQTDAIPTVPASKKLV